MSIHCISQARNLTHHVIAAECGDSYRDKPLPYKEEMVYTQALDDEEGNGFWKPSLLQFDGYTFYLQVSWLLVRIELISPVSSHCR